MKYLVDTNIISEMSKLRPESRVKRWFESIADDDIFISVITLGEIEKGMEGMETGRRRNDLMLWFGQIQERFSNRFLSIDKAVAKEWGRLSSRQSQLSTADGLIAATAVAHDLILSTRNIGHFHFLLRPVVNPFDPA
ncbi:MAG: hypothetical protein A3G34_06700 [Candidatus Lindowbacteria bacterium RIFCSPLOWO2_12_FULL_62_27]|nr:MAG: hypothetical protein A3G34_06700 [Candidatus Lindowbacteria bacterium RIFCSPLOWO2_12_FULL_62_27]OGH56644.1 MAG: hypothetical protein A3I06_14530 [Candidatus Lindowbacteria bacterium RIFCSPLOWO2_02_FULL_62_12]